MTYKRQNVASCLLLSMTALLGGCQGCYQGNLKVFDGGSESDIGTAQFRDASFIHPDNEAEYRVFGLCTSLFAESDNSNQVFYELKDKAGLLISGNTECVNDRWSANINVSELQDGVVALRATQGLETVKKSVEKQSLGLSELTVLTQNNDQAYPISGYCQSDEGDVRVLVDRKHLDTFPCLSNKVSGKLRLSSPGHADRLCLEQSSVQTADQDIPKSGFFIDSYSYADHLNLSTIDRLQFSGACYEDDQSIYFILKDSVSSERTVSDMCQDNQWHVSYEIQSSDFKSLKDGQIRAQFVVNDQVIEEIPLTKKSLLFNDQEEISNYNAAVYALSGACDSTLSVDNIDIVILWDEQGNSLKQEVTHTVQCASDNTWDAVMDLTTLPDGILKVEAIDTHAHQNTTTLVKKTLTVDGEVTPSSYPLMPLLGRCVLGNDIEARADNEPAEFLGVTQLNCLERQGEYVWGGTLDLTDYAGGNILFELSDGITWVRRMILKDRLLIQPEQPETITQNAIQYDLKEYLPYSCRDRSEVAIVMFEDSDGKREIKKMICPGDHAKWIIEGTDGLLIDLSMLKDGPLQMTIEYYDKQEHMALTKDAVTINALETVTDQNIGGYTIAGQCISQVGEIQIEVADAERSKPYSTDCISDEWSILLGDDLYDLNNGIVFIRLKQGSTEEQIIPFNKKTLMRTNQLPILTSDNVADYFNNLFFEDCTENEIINLSVNYQNKTYSIQSTCISQSWYSDDDFLLTELQDNDENLFSITTEAGDEIFSGYFSKKTFNLTDPETITDHNITAYRIGGRCMSETSAEIKIADTLIDTVICDDHSWSTDVLDMTDFSVLNVNIRNLKDAVVIAEIDHVLKTHVILDRSVDPLSVNTDNVSEYDIAAYLYSSCVETDSLQLSISSSDESVEAIEQRITCQQLSWQNTTVDLSSFPDGQLSMKLILNEETQPIVEKFLFDKMILGISSTLDAVTDLTVEQYPLNGTCMTSDDPIKLVIKQAEVEKILETVCINNTWSLLVQLTQFENGVLKLSLNQGSNVALLEQSMLMKSIIIKAATNEIPELSDINSAGLDDTFLQSTLKTPCNTGTEVDVVLTDEHDTSSTMRFRCTDNVWHEVLSAQLETLSDGAVEVQIQHNGASLVDPVNIVKSTLSVSPMAAIGSHDLDQPYTVSGNCLAGDVQGTVVIESSSQAFDCDDDGHWSSTFAPSALLQWPDGQLMVTATQGTVEVDAILIKETLQVRAVDIGLETIDLLYEMAGHCASNGVPVMIQLSGQEVAQTDCVQHTWSEILPAATIQAQPDGALIISVSQDTTEQTLLAQITVLKSTLDIDVSEITPDNFNSYVLSGSCHFAATSQDVRVRVFTLGEGVEAETALEQMVICQQDDQWTVPVEGFQLGGLIDGTLTMSVLQNHNAYSVTQEKRLLTLETPVDVLMSNSDSYQLSGHCVGDQTVDISIQDSNALTVTADTACTSEGQWDITDMNLTALETGPLDIQVSQSYTALNADVIENTVQATVNKLILTLARPLAAVTGSNESNYRVSGHCVVGTDVHIDVEGDEHMADCMDVHWSEVLDLSVSTSAQISLTVSQNSNLIAVQLTRSQLQFAMQPMLGPNDLNYPVSGSCRGEEVVLLTLIASSGTDIEQQAQCSNGTFISSFPIAQIDTEFYIQAKQGAETAETGRIKKSIITLLQSDIAGSEITASGHCAQRPETEIVLKVTDGITVIQSAVQCQEGLWSAQVTDTLTSGKPLSILGCQVIDSTLHTTDTKVLRAL